MKSGLTLGLFEPLAVLANPQPGTDLPVLLVEEDEPVEVLFLLGR